MTYTGMALWLASVAFLCIIAGLDGIQIIIVGFLAVFATIEVDSE